MDGWSLIPPIFRSKSRYQLKNSPEQGSTRILPSPIRPVRAWPTIALIATGDRLLDEDAQLNLGHERVLYSLPRYRWSRFFCRPYPIASRTVPPRISIDSSASRTACARNGLTSAMIWTTPVVRTTGEKHRRAVRLSRVLESSRDMQLPIETPAADRLTSRPLLRNWSNTGTIGPAAAPECTR